MIPVPEYLHVSVPYLVQAACFHTGVLLCLSGDQITPGRSRSEQRLPSHCDSL